VADIVAGLGCSHAPSIAHLYDDGRTRDPEWNPLFAAFKHAEQWLVDARPDVLVCIYNDHIDHFSLDAWPQFAIGTGDSFNIADEGWSPRPFPPVPGHPVLARHIAAQLVEAGIDIAVAHRQVLDHGILSPLPVINTDWAFPVVPIAVNVIFDPRPSPARCWALGAAIGDAIASFEPGLRIAVVGTGGLSHQLTGSNFGDVRPEWDREFLRLIDQAPEDLTGYSLADFARLGGEHSAEIVQWMAMRAALPAGSEMDFAYYYPRQIMGYGIAGFRTPAGAAAGGLT
jgi:hypothetical protein